MKLKLYRLQKNNKISILHKSNLKFCYVCTLGNMHDCVYI